jgi:predicted dehydrogenase
MKARKPGRTRTEGGISRRSWLGLAAVETALMIVPRHVLGGAGHVAPSGKTTLACIGMGGQGQQNLMSLLEFPEIQIIAVCDVNRESADYLSANWSQGRELRSSGREPARRLVEAHYAQSQRSGKYRGCSGYSDFRELLIKEDVDAVMIATPDHTHAVITMAALKRRKHVYCEKPLAYSVEETRVVTETARRVGVATQLGNHRQAMEEAMVVQELIADGAIGPVREVQVWCPARFWAAALYEQRPPETPPIPAELDWDLWLGPALQRPYHPAYHPWTWRNWWDFGTGQLGDLGCHKLSNAFKALKLGYPTSVEASSTKLNAETYPLGVLARFEFPKRGSMPPLTISWQDGGLRPPRPPELETDRSLADIIYIGETGKIMGSRLIPEARQKAYGRPPRTLPRSPGHFREWVEACRGGPPAGSNFVDHSGLLSEVCALGNVAVRVQKKLLWDGPNMKITNDPRATQLLHREYRSGWTL